MTEEEIKEAEKSFRASIWFHKWIFIIYGNWKWRIKNMGQSRFEILEFHPWRAKKSVFEP